MPVLEGRARMEYLEHIQDQQPVSKSGSVIALEL